MTPLCSVLLPSRSRLMKCLHCVASFKSAQPEREDFEVLIRVDRDDPQLTAYTQLFNVDQVKVIAGDRGRGFRQFNKYITELAAHSQAPWIMQFNDDATITGPWLSELEKVKDPHTIVVCEWHRLGGSAYQNDWGGPFPILPNGFWKFLGLDEVPLCADTDSVRGLKDLGWPVHFLKGVSFHHQRDDNETLEAHRKL